MEKLKCCVTKNIHIRFTDNRKIKLYIWVYPQTNNYITIATFFFNKRKTSYGIWFVREYGKFSSSLCISQNTVITKKKRKKSQKCKPMSMDNFWNDNLYFLGYIFKLNAKQTSNLHQMYTHWLKWLDSYFYIFIQNLHKYISQILII